MMTTQNKFDYAQQFGALEEIVRLVAVMLEGVDIDQIRVTLERADSVGAIFDPTAYKKALQDGRLDKQRELLRSVQPLAAYIKKRKVAEMEALNIALDAITP